MAAIRVGQYSFHVYEEEIDPQDIPECTWVVYKRPGSVLTEDDVHQAIAKAKQEHYIHCPGCVGCSLSMEDKFNADKV